MNCDDDDAVMALVNAIEEAWDADNLAECDKAWDAMHRCLTDGQLKYGNGPDPLNYCVLGPRWLHRDDSYIVSFVPAEKVQEVAAALRGVTKEWFWQQYYKLVPKDYAPEYGEPDLDYTWDWFEVVREFYAKAAERGRAVIFTADQ